MVGAAAGSLIVLGRGVYRQCWVLLAEALLLAAAALCYAFGLSDVAVAAIVLAMGLENAVFQIHGGAGLGLTYVTGALVKVGQLAAAALDRRRALGVAAEPAAVGGAGGRRGCRRARLSLDQPRRDLVCRRDRARRWAALFSQQRSCGIDSERCLSELNNNDNRAPNPAPHA